jgi:hypothetical protein
MEALKMETPMTEWNDDRLDEMNGRMKDGLLDVGKRFEPLATKEEMSEVRAELRGLNQRFDRLLHTLMVIAWGFAGTVLAALVGALAVLL